MGAFILPPAVDYCLRLLLATLCGAAIGLERSFRRKEAGLRTHAILSLASALFMILSKYAFYDSPTGADPTMIACQIVMGINFLGAGIVFNSNRTVTTGLSTTAGIWATTAIGMACGAGLRTLAVLCTLLTLGLQLLMNHFNWGGSSMLPQEVRITVVNTPEVWEILRQARQKYHVEILSMKYKRRHDNTVTLILQAHLPKPIPMQTALHFIDRHKDVREISI